MTLRRRIDRVEERARSLPAPPRDTCRDWPGDLLAFLAINDPLRRDEGERRCPDCGRRPPTTVTLEQLIEQQHPALDW